jgi:hypothetical protein
MEKRALNVNSNPIPINTPPQLPSPMPRQVLPQRTELYGFSFENIVTD